MIADLQEIILKCEEIEEQDEINFEEDTFFSKIRLLYQLFSSFKAKY